ncbi:Hypothetical predicted protein [Mytilus galloprovincialis]|uniref:C-type lectin domain-containing protein n=1 Tax=Mytilus galloprovincialis TaxID=29158 RepID=A0A8B6H3U5_MYTGA|nr:Hypothetical predicted protein [Mytilus galloprovincialis]
METKMCAVLAIFIVPERLCCSGEWGSQHPVVYTVYNEKKTWNDAKAICYANNNTMLSMPNDNVWQFWISMFDLTTTVPHRDNPRFWFGLHSTNPANLSELYWDDCRVADWVEWTIYRPSYIPEHYQCLGFDVDFHPLTTVTYILWLSIACQEQNRFICVWENECIYQTCEEFLIIMPVSQCTSTTACTVLSALGEVTNFAACRARPINFGNQSICHVYMTPAVVFVTQSFSICYKPAVDAPLKRCQNVSDTLDLGLFNDLSTTPNSTCKSPDLSTTLSGMFLTTTEGNCECPCQRSEDTTGPPLTIDQKIEIMKRELTIDKTKTSKSKRKLISVSDERPSAKGLGVFGLAILVLVPVCILLIDLTSISRHVNYFCERKMEQTEKFRIPSSSEEKPSKSYKENSDRRISTAFINNKTSDGRMQFTNIYTKDERNKENRPSSAYPINMQSSRSSSVICVRPKTPVNSKVEVVYKDILDVKYQSSMIASRIIASEVKSGKRRLSHHNAAFKGKDIGEKVKRKSAKDIRLDGLAWIHML